MYQVEDEPIQTTHLYVVREGPARPSLAPIVLSLFTLALLILVGVHTSSTQPEIRTAIRVPAVPLFMKTFSAPIKVIPTGRKTYPATVAYGALNLRNGSVISQTIPAGFTLTATNGTQVTTDTAVFVPAATADGFGMATVAAHIAVAGVNLPAFAINQVIGTSLFIRNLSAFTGAYPAYSVKFVTQQDKLRAIDQTRAFLASQVVGLHYPCRETITTILTWHCQFVSYSLPSYMHVTSAMLQGNSVVVTVWFIAHPRRIWVK